jgi:hypothetical protein
MDCEEKETTKGKRPCSGRINAMRRFWNIQGLQKRGAYINKGSAAN